MRKKKTPLELGKRERQIVETVVKLGEAAVSDVRKELADPPSYSAVRATMTLLVEKKWLKYRQDGKRYLYRPAAGQKKAQRKRIDSYAGHVFCWFADRCAGGFARFFCVQII